MDNIRKDILTELLTLIPEYGEFTLPLVEFPGAISPINTFENQQAGAIEKWFADQKTYRVYTLRTAAMGFLVAEDFAVFRHDLQVAGRTYIQLTDKGRKLKELKTLDIYVKWSKKPKKEFWYFIVGTTATVLAGLIGSLPGIIEEVRKVPQNIIIPSKSVNIVHDTVYLKSRQDTSLIRIVKRPLSKEK